MTKEEFEQKLRAHPRPVVVDFLGGVVCTLPDNRIGAGTIGEGIRSRVDTWKVNADEEIELVRSLHVYGIPTLIAYRDGKDVARQTGAAPWRL